MHPLLDHVEVTVMIDNGAVNVMCAMFTNMSRLPVHLDLDFDRSTCSFLSSRYDDMWDVLLHTPRGFGEVHTQA